MPVSVFLTLKPIPEKGSVATDHEPYKGTTQILPLSESLRSLPNGVCDIFENGAITRKVNKVVFNGTENKWLHFFEPTVKINQFYIPLNDFELYPNEISCYSDKFKPISIANRNGNYGTVYAFSTGVAFNIDPEIYENMDEWKEFLTGNPVTVFYPCI